MEAHLVERVQTYLSLYQYDTAKFLCERLVAGYPSEHNTYLLATCYKTCNQAYRALHLLQGKSSPQCRYLFALCCVELGRHQEAEAALLKEGPDKVPNGAAGLYVLANVARSTGRTRVAATYLQRALQQDPLMWAAFEELCALGYDDMAAQFCTAPEPPSPSQPPEQQQAQQQAQPTQQAQQQAQQQLQQPQQPQQRLAHSRQAPQQRQPCVGFSPAAAALSAMSIDGSADDPGSTPEPRAGPTHLFEEGTDRSCDTASGSGAFEHGGGGGASFMATPQALAFVTPSPQAGPGAPPAIAPKPAGASTAAGATTAGGAFPSFGQGRAAGPPSGRTPAMARQRGGAPPPPPPPRGPGVAFGAGRARKGVKAAGRLFAEPSAAPRRSARLAAAHPHGDATPSPLGSRPRMLDLQQEQEHQAQHMQQQHQPEGGAGDATPLQQRGRQAEPAGAEPSLFVFAAAGGRRLGAAGGLQSAPTAPRDLKQQLHAVFGPLRTAVRHLAALRCSEVVRALQALPAPHYATAWVMVTAGRALLELVDYPAAASSFQVARRLDPYRVEGMETYSTVLWHLKRDIELAHLAHEMMAVDRLAPSTWCVAGNLYSLQREHEQALRCFQRALQLQPRMAYAATLAGHEHLAGNDLEAALVAYRTALSSEPRHYNAMYGLGQVYLRQEKPEMALQQFRAASAIHPASSVLHCCQGVALQRLGRQAEALGALDAAVATDPRNPLAHYERASLMLALDRHDDALAELKVLQGIAPLESSVHFLRGKVCKRLGFLDTALTCFNAALDLMRPGGDAPAVKHAIERLHVTDEEEEEEL